MWMTREQISQALGIVPNSVRGKVKKGLIERKSVEGKNLYRVVDPKLLARLRTNLPEAIAAEPTAPSPDAALAPESRPDSREETKAARPERSDEFNPRKALLDQLASIKTAASITAIEKGDDTDLATEEISRELEARLTMIQLNKVKDIEDALEKLKRGEYGECEECGEDIPQQRLRLFPEARMCVKCQEEYDRQEKLRGSLGARETPWREIPEEGSYA